MRYTEPKARSAELLRVCLGHMGQHTAALNPMTFTVWYEYVAGINPPLYAAIETLLRDGTPIDDARILRLYETHISPGDDAAVQRITGEFQVVMSGIASSASQTGAQAGLFGAQLGDLSAALATTQDGVWSPRLHEALAGTQEMKTSAEALQREVQASQSEIARLREDLERVRGEALVDPMTQVLNRKGFDQHIAKLLETPSAPGREHCLVLLDIDHFKSVNDTHGHVMGDRVLQGLGQILRQATGGAKRAAARYGGEEFAILLADASLDEALHLAEQVRLRAKALKIRNRTTQEVLVTITVSGGVTAARPGETASTLIARADRALYDSKAAGRDRVSRA